MNAKVRKQLSLIIDKVSDIQFELEEIRDSEQEKYDNMPEGLQGSDRGDAMMECVEHLETSCSLIDDLKSELESIE